MNTIFRREKVKKEGLINHETLTGELYTPEIDSNLNCLLKQKSTMINTKRIAKHVLNL